MNAQKDGVAVADVPISSSQLEPYYKEKMDSLIQQFRWTKNQYDSQSQSQDPGQRNSMSVDQFLRSQSQSLLPAPSTSTKLSLGHVLYVGTETIRSLVTYFTEGMERIPLLDIQDSFWDKLVDVAGWMNDFVDYLIRLSGPEAQGVGQLGDKDLIDTGLVYLVDFLLDFIKGQEENGTRDNVVFLLAAYELVAQIIQEFKPAQIKLIMIEKLIPVALELIDGILHNLQTDPFGRAHFWKREVLMNYLKLLEAVILSSSKEFLQANPTIDKQLETLKTKINQKLESYSICCLFVTRIHATFKVIQSGKGPGTQSLIPIGVFE